MTPDRPQKIKLLRLLDLLQRETDVDHPISRQNLCKCLNDMGISSNLRTLSLDIETLNDAGYEIMENQVGHEKFYYVEDRDFSLPELKVLIDAVEAASFISKKRSDELVEKIASLGGEHRADLLKRNMVCFNKRCFKCGKDSDPIKLEEMALDHTMPLAYLYRLDESATCLCSSHNSQKSDHFPVDYYSEEELVRLSEITGLSLETLHKKEVNTTVLNLLIEHVVWFYDEFLMEPDYQKIRDGIRTADKINDSLKRVIGGIVDLAAEYKKRTGRYPTSVTIL